MAKQVTMETFATAPDGRPVQCFTMTNAKGAQVQLLEYGASIHKVLVPDRSGKLGNITLSFDSLEPELRALSCAGAICGPVANRITGAAFELNGIRYELEKNNGENHLHGGSSGFHRKVWQGSVVSDRQVRFTLERPDGDGGYPGNLRAEVTYIWDDNCALTVEYYAVSDRDTVCNLTNHAYWSLDGYDPGTDVLDQEIQVFSDHYTEMDASVTPTGRILTSEAALDLREPKNVRQMLSRKAEQLASMGEFGHTYALQGSGLKPAAVLTGPQSGRRLRVYTTYPGVLFYSGFEALGFRSGIALECQYYPDALRHPQFPSIVLPAGKEYRETTVYCFDTV